MPFHPSHPDTVSMDDMLQMQCMTACMYGNQDVEDEILMYLHIRCPWWQT